MYRVEVGVSVVFTKHQRTVCLKKNCLKKQVDKSENRILTTNCLEKTNGLTEHNLKQRTNLRTLKKNKTVFRIKT